MSRFLTGFKFAWAGVRHHFRSQLNAKIQLMISLMVITSALVLGISRIEWCIILLCIVMVFAVEAINTAIESLADAIHPERHPLVGTAKDVAAGAVLFCAIGSAIIGAIIFLPYFGIRL